MSNEARQWAWSLPDLPTPVRLLLVALAEHVRDGTTCFPGQTRLAAMCSISERQVRNLLRELQVRGLITVEHRAGQGAGRRSNLYRLAMGKRQRDSDCPEGYLEAAFRNGGSGCERASGNPVPGNRNSGAGNRNAASAESKERTLRTKHAYPVSSQTTRGERGFAFDGMRAAAVRRAEFICRRLYEGLRADTAMWLR